MVSAVVRTEVSRIVELLSSGNYDAVARITGSVRLSAPEIEAAVRGYGGTVCPPPEDAYDLLDAVKVSTTASDTWSINFNLWTLEEGQSDLTVSLTVTSRGGASVVELDDIHVM